MKGLFWKEGPWERSGVALGVEFGRCTELIRLLNINVGVMSDRPCGERGGGNLG